MKITNIIYSLLLLILFSGCTKYLEVTPDNRIEPNTLEKTSELLVAAYPRADYFFTDWMTDQVEYIESNTQISRITKMFNWEAVEEDDSYNTPTNYWTEAYAAIAQANSALDALAEIQDSRDEYRNAIKGEALICRAYSHFMLVSLFSKNYDASTASSDLGVPYVTESEKTLLKQYERNSVKEVYDLVEKDLLDGINLLSDKYFYGSKKYHFTREAAYALACRFYLFKGEYDKSLEYGNKILGANTVNTSYIKNLVAYSNQSGSTAKRRFFVEATDRSNLLIVEKQIGIGLRRSLGYRKGILSWRDDYTDTNLWGSNNDLRSSMGYYGDGARNVIGMAKYDEEFYKESLTATTGFPFFVQPVIRGEEILFNRIECYIKTAKYSLALESLNLFAQHRYETPNTLDLATLKSLLITGGTAPSDEEAVMFLYLDEKRKEFLQEGMRWFDIKRHSIPVVHTKSDGEKITLEADDLRKVLQIPAVASRRGIQKNPR